MRAYIIQGHGTMTRDGETTTYPIYRLVLANTNTGNSLEFKVDKINRRLLPALFNLTSTGEMVEDVNGVQCNVLEIEE